MLCAGEAVDRSRPGDGPMRDERERSVAAHARVSGHATHWRRITARLREAVAAMNGLNRGMNEANEGMHQANAAMFGANAPMDDAIGRSAGAARRRCCHLLSPIGGGSSVPRIGR